MVWLQSLPSGTVARPLVEAGSPPALTSEHKIRISKDPDIGICLGASCPYGGGFIKETHHLKFSLFLYIRVTGELKGFYLHGNRGWPST